ncbi:hypothetical protein [Kibdelosporangium phytohabitans]|uniref:Uncharacterized protein n=1 Tax=Kibdelosporangium phytohabitans TaxID=860235 RepID=A0A0N9HRH1_9PSEU|nr:hypothetical protein [Kibdelosporangium phytohabitans]ALG05717.1 hypothetical protein AOZ06_01155 [Kibdelosporangium phytohabitans]MBE1466293.1 hypothetical protein [Kibdelosporangium phytohabitans]
MLMLSLSTVWVCSIGRVWKSQFTAGQIRRAQRGIEQFHALVDNDVLLGDVDEAGQRRRALRADLVRHGRDEGLLPPCAEDVVGWVFGVWVAAVQPVWDNAKEIVAEFAPPYLHGFPWLAAAIGVGIAVAVLRNVRRGKPRR